MVDFLYESLPDGYILTGSFEFEIRGIPYSLVDGSVTLLDEMMYLQAGIIWNGSNMVPDHPKSLKASLCHDVFYSLISKGLLPRSCRPLADAFYRDLCIASGMRPWKARLRHRILRVVWTPIDFFKGIFS
jgi:hypothetical protein